MLPNIWLLVGIKSPSSHAVGLMGVGLPVFAIGRNPQIAWGGTNMRAASSELYDISGLPAAAVTERRERIRVRWWFDREITIRETPHGPILSDAPFLAEMGAPPVALKWTGHMSSDEITAMLKVSRARDFAGFRAAFSDFAVPGQNMLYADAAGNIGQVMAVRLPAPGEAPPGDIVLDAKTRAAAWRQLRKSADLPFSYNPVKGFLASANNRPARGETQIGYFFSPDDRVARMADIVARNGKLEIDDLKRMQRDVYMSSAVALRDLLLAKLDDSGIAATGAARRVVARMRAWDGHYRADSSGAVAFELFRAAFTTAFYTDRFGDQDWAAFANVSRIKVLLREDIASAPAARIGAALESALGAAAERIDKFADWGSMHRLELSHPLGMLPVIGGRYRFVDTPVGGSTDTLMKTAHGATRDRHAARYGSNARHISDMGDMDRNYFVLLGGQDGKINAAASLDQLPLWRDGRYIQLPLRIETVHSQFRHRTVLAP